MKPEVAFGLVLKSARQQKGVSQEALAFKSDLDRTFISMLERGLRQPSLTSIIALATSLELAPDELVRKTVDLMAGHGPGQHHPQ